MQDTLTQVGVGGIFTVIILREVFNFLNRRNNKHPGPNGYVRRAELECLKATVQYKDNCAEITKRLDDMLSALEKQVEIMRQQNLGKQ